MAALAHLAQASAEIIEWGNDTVPSELIAEHDFALISFYHSDEKAIEVDMLMEGAKAHLEKQIADGEIGERDIAWFRVDIEKYPDLAFDDSSMADQMIINNLAGLQRWIHFEKTHDEAKDAEEHLALIIQELSGDWFTEIECSEIQAETRFFYDEVVYMGDPEDLKADGSAEILNTMAMVDRYNFDQQRAGFYYNSDPKCRSEHDLEEEKKYVVYYNGVNSLPYHLTLDEDFINFE